MKIGRLEIYWRKKVKVPNTPTVRTPNQYKMVKKIVEEKVAEGIDMSAVLPLRSPVSKVGK